MNSGRPTPILVVGLNRSGTKWLSNLLCNHPQIFGVQTSRHGGVVETDMFGAMSSVVGDLRTLENYVALVELWSQTDFVATTRVEKEFLYGLRPRPTNCFDMFRCLIDEAARRADARFWLQKTGPIEGRAALRAFPDARVIVIERDPVETLESRVQLRRNRGVPLSVARGALESVFQRKLLDQIRRRHDVIDVEYQSLLHDTASEVGRVCGSLGLEFAASMLEVPFRPNTSFRERGSERRVFERHERWMVRLITAAGRLAPAMIFEAARSLLRDRSPHFVPGTFAEIADRNGLGAEASTRGDS